MAHGSLNKAQLFSRRAHLLEIEKIASAAGPFRLIAQPAEREIQPRRSHPAVELRRGASRPTRPLVLDLALLRNLRWPRLRQSDQIDFAACNRRRFPINSADHLPFHPNSLRIKLPVN